MKGPIKEFVLMGGVCAFASLLNAEAVMGEDYVRLWSPQVNAAIDARIEAHRKADAAVGGFSPGTVVRVEQTDHAFLFGAHIFNFDQLGRDGWNAQYKAAFTNLLNAATLAFYWKSYEPVPGQLRFAAGPHDSAAFWNSVAELSPKEKYERFVEYRRPAPDPIVEFCEQNRIEMHGHVMIYPPYHPAWTTNGATQAEILARYKKRIGELADHYGARIPQWDVVNESVRRDCSPDAPDDKICWGNPQIRVPDDYTFHCFKEAERRLAPGVKTVINEACVIDNIYFAFVQSLLDRGARIDVVGLQYHIFNAHEMRGLVAGHHNGRYGYTYTPERIIETLRNADKLGRPIHISEITIPAPEVSPWGEAVQARVLRDLYRLWFSWPSVYRITYWNLVDFTYHRESLSSGFYAKDMRRKQVWHAMDKLLNHEWKTRLTVTADTTGTVAFRGFRGRYRLSWKDENGMNLSKAIDVK